MRGLDPATCRRRTLAPECRRMGSDPRARRLDAEEGALYVTWLGDEVQLGAQSHERRVVGGRFGFGFGIVDSDPGDFSRVIAWFEHVTLAAARLILRQIVELGHDLLEAGLLALDRTGDGEADVGHSGTSCCRGG